MRPRPLARIALAFPFAALLAAQPPASSPPPSATSPAAAAPAAPAAPATDPVSRLRDEGLNRSEVMATLVHLTDIVGPRLTGSPELRRASEWARDRFTAWGLQNAALEPWGTFGRGWSLRRFSAQIVAPQAIPLIAYPKAWSPTVGADGRLETDLVHVDIKKPEDFERYRGKLRGKIVLDGSLAELKVKFDPLALRRTDAQLLALANSDGTAARPAPTAAASGAPGTPAAPAAAPTSPLATPEGRAAAALTPRRYQFFSEEGVALLLQPSRLGEAGNLFVSAATVYPPRDPAADAKAPAKSDNTKSGVTPPLRNVQPWKTDAPPIIPQVTLAAEHFNRLVRLAQAGEPLRAAVELKTDYHTADLAAYNVVAEIPGTDLAGEIVMLGAHLDSWHSGTGATDNAAGCAVVMEAVRLLRVLDLKPRRTIRVALWSGEEQGIFGSKGYVAAHFGAPRVTTPAGSGDTDPQTTTRFAPTADITKLPGYEKLSAYFNLDNGGGKIRGIYLQNNEAARSLFRAWLRPFRDLGAETVSLANTGGTDHLPFDQIGLPAFQFIQDELEYNTRTHHGNMDVADRVIADDLKQASVIMAAFVYQAAMRDEKIPRKPAPAPTPAAPAGKKKKSAE